MNTNNLAVMKLIELHLPQNLHVFQMIIGDGHTRNDINWQATQKARPSRLKSQC